MSDATAHEAAPQEAPTRKRPKPGERRLQILQTLAEMLEHPKGERVTTALLASKLDVSEAALYRHFASKAQMYEGLIEFIETSVFGLINQITTQEDNGLKQTGSIVAMLLKFAVSNRGMTRVLIGDALVLEDERLQVRINQFVDRVEAAVRQSLRTAASQGQLSDSDPGARAGVIVAAVLGRWHRYAKSGFKLDPAQGIDAQLRVLLT